LAGPFSQGSKFRSFLPARWKCFELPDLCATLAGPINRGETALRARRYGMGFRFWFRPSVRPGGKFQGLMTRATPPRAKPKTEIPIQRRLALTNPFESTRREARIAAGPHAIVSRQGDTPTTPSAESEIRGSVVRKHTRRSPEFHAFGFLLAKNRESRTLDSTLTQTYLPRPTPRVRAHRFCQAISTNCLPQDRFATRALPTGICISNSLPGASTSSSSANTTRAIQGAGWGLARGCSKRAGRRTPTAASRP